MKNIIFYHIPKTAGRTIRNSISIAIIEKKLQKKLSDEEKRQIQKLIANGNLSWENVNVGDLLYTDHIPFWKLKQIGFTLTSIRDPLDRIQSHYSDIVSLLPIRPHHIYGYDIEKDTKLDHLGFLKTCPKKTLNRMTYHFSKDFNVDEAFNRITNLDLVMFTNDLENCFLKLNKLLDLNVEINSTGITQEKRKSDRHLLLNHIDIIQDKMKEDIELYNRLLNWYKD